MIKKWLLRTSYALFALAALFTLLGLLYLLFPTWNDEEILVLESPARPLPRRAFQQPPEAYNQIGPPFLSLQFSPMQMQLPDLRRLLIYYGPNARPDAKGANTVLHIGFIGANGSVATALPGHPLYLTYDRAKPQKYNFSPDNEKTPLWIELRPQDKAAQISVHLEDENGNRVTDPQAHAAFTLPEKELVRFSKEGLEIGNWRVDGSLLAQQKGRWYGEDLFLDRHGGPEYASLTGKQRIDFGEGDDLYSVFVGSGDGLIWMEDRWVEAQPGEGTLQYPLLVIKKINDRLMNLELWGVDGKGRLPLNLIRSTQRRIPFDIENRFKFVGARTLSQLVFDIDGQRMLLRPKDWLLESDGTWTKLNTAEEIDGYVDRKSTGLLFIFDEIAKKEGKQVVKATLFDPTRTEMQQIEIPMDRGPATAIKSEETPKDVKPVQVQKPISELGPPAVMEQDDDEDDEDEDDDDDED